MKEYVILDCGLRVYKKCASCKHSTNVETTHDTIKKCKLKKPCSRIKACNRWELRPQLESIKRSGDGKVYRHSDHLLIWKNRETKELNREKTELNNTAGLLRQYPDREDLKLKVNKLKTDIRNTYSTLEYIDKAIQYARSTELTRNPQRIEPEREMTDEEFWEGVKMSIIGLKTKGLCKRSGWRKVNHSNQPMQLIFDRSADNVKFPTLTVISHEYQVNTLHNASPFDILMERIQREVDAMLEPFKRKEPLPNYLLKTWLQRL